MSGDLSLLMSVGVRFSMREREISPWHHERKIPYLRFSQKANDCACKTQTVQLLLYASLSRIFQKDGRELIFDSSFL